MADKAADCRDLFGRLIPDAVSLEQLCAAMGGPTRRHASPSGGGGSGGGELPEHLADSFKRVLDILEQLRNKYEKQPDAKEDNKNLAEQTGKSVEEALKKATDNKKSPIDDPAHNALLGRARAAVMKMTGAGRDLHKAFDLVQHDLSPSHLQGLERLKNDFRDLPAHARRNAKDAMYDIQKLNVQLEMAVNDVQEQEKIYNKILDRVRSIANINADDHINWYRRAQNERRVRQDQSKWYKGFEEAREAVSDISAKLTHVFNKIIPSAHGLMPAFDLKKLLNAEELTEWNKNIHALMFETLGLTGSAISGTNDLQKAWHEVGLNIDEAYVTTGQLSKVWRDTLVKNIRRGLGEERQFIRVTQVGLSTAKLLGASAESTADEFANWHQHLGLSTSSTVRMGRELQMVARLTGVTGDNLIEAAKQARTLATEMRNAGTYTDEAARKLIQVAAAAKKYGTEQSIQPLMEAMSSSVNLYNKTDEKTRALLFNAAARAGKTGRIGDLQSGQLLNTPEGMKDMADGLEKLLLQFTGGKKVSELSAQELMGINLVLHAAYGKQAKEMELTIKTLREGSMSIRDKIAELVKDIEENGKYMSAEEIRGKEEQKASLIGLKMNEEIKNGINALTKTLTEAKGKKLSEADTLKLAQQNLNKAGYKGDLAAGAQEITDRLTREMKLEKPEDIDKKIGDLQQFITKLRENPIDAMTDPMAAANAAKELAEKMTDLQKVQTQKQAAELVGKINESIATLRKANTNPDEKLKATAELERNLSKLSELSEMDKKLGHLDESTKLETMQNMLNMKVQRLAETGWNLLLSTLHPGVFAGLNAAGGLLDLILGTLHQMLGLLQNLPGLLGKGGIFGMIPGGKFLGNLLGIGAGIAVGETIDALLGEKIKEWTENLFKELGEKIGGGLGKFLQEQSGLFGDLGRTTARVSSAFLTTFILTGNPLAAFAAGLFEAIMSIKDAVNHWQGVMMKRAGELQTRIEGILQEADRALASAARIRSGQEKVETKDIDETLEALKRKEKDVEGSREALRTASAIRAADIESEHNPFWVAKQKAKEGLDANLKLVEALREKYDAQVDYITKESRKKYEERRARERAEFVGPPAPPEPPAPPPGPITEAPRGRRGAESVAFNPARSRQSFNDIQRQIELLQPGNLTNPNDEEQTKELQEQTAKLQDLGLSNKQIAKLMTELLKVWTEKPNQSPVVGPGRTASETVQASIARYYSNAYPGTGTPNGAVTETMG